VHPFLDVNTTLVFPDKVRLRPDSSFVLSFDALVVAVVVNSPTMIFIASLKPSDPGAGTLSLAFGPLSAFAVHLPFNFTPKNCIAYFGDVA